MHTPKKTSIPPLKKKEFDVVVVGAGHAGLEAAVAASKHKMNTALITMDTEKIVSISCNPSIGGLGKSQMVMELQALGGKMPYIADVCALQYKMLNQSKGMAVWALRAQIDKHQYCKEAKKIAQNTQHLNIVQDCVEQLIIEKNGNDSSIKGVCGQSGIIYSAKAVVLATGTFLGGKIFMGDESVEGGRIGEFAATKLADTMRQQGFEIRRFKTGTPARIHKDSIDYTLLEAEMGDVNKNLSFTGDLSLNKNKKMPCFKTFTNEKTHEIIRKNENLSPLYSGTIEGIGPRYCPSIEDKISRFPDRTRHQLFLEPEGAECDEYYVNGLSSCMPKDVQEQFIRTIPGLQNVAIIKYAYAVEYDYINPTHLTHSLESKKVQNLFFAGQINGTSGYEEAASQGFIAGLNAVMKITHQQPIILSRYQSYIGVLIDDLVLKGTKEPYRMFTSRAENRLHMRSDNAWVRLHQIAKKANIISLETLEKNENKIKKIEKIRERIKKERFYHLPKELIQRHFDAKEMEIVDNLSNTYKGQDKRTAIAYLIRRGEINLEHLIEILCDFFDEPKEIVATACCDEKYADYVERHLAQQNRMENLMTIAIPPNFDFFEIDGLKKEAKEKWKKISPKNLSEAARVAGVTPSDVEILLFYLTKKKKKS